MPYGYNGRILRVDLTNEQITVEEPGEAFYRTYMGGAMALDYILKEMPAHADPLGPENVLVVSTGVMTGAGHHPALPGYRGAGDDAEGDSQDAVWRQGIHPGGAFLKKVVHAETLATEVFAIEVLRWLFHVERPGGQIDAQDPSIVSIRHHNLPSFSRPELGP